MNIEIKRNNKTLYSLKEEDVKNGIKNLDEEIKKINYFSDFELERVEIIPKQIKLTKFYYGDNENVDKIIYHLKYLYV